MLHWATGYLLVGMGDLQDAPPCLLIYPSVRLRSQALMLPVLDLFDTAAGAGILHLSFGLRPNGEVFCEL